MGTVSHREMRNQSGEILRRVERGETVVVTNHGKPVAVMSPVVRSVLDELADRGQVRRAVHGAERLSEIKRAHLPVGTAELLADSRGAW